jgi:deoxyribodipyrimidine photolyase-related protein
VSSYGKLRLILGDQLNLHHPWFGEVDPQVLYVFIEARSEAEYVIHHVQKVVAFFVAMRAFERTLSEAGHHTHYVRLDDPDNAGDFARNIRRLVEQYGVREVEYQLPDEHRLDRVLAELEGALPVPVRAVDTFHFYTERDELESFFRGKKLYLMENFYRHMRKKHRVLMDHGQPVTGQWNYDEDNRKRLPDGEVIPKAKLFVRDVSDVVAMIRAAGVKTIGNLEPERFVWPVTRKEALELLEHFIEHLLPRFGVYQDAMTPRDWSLFHSRLSFSMNVKLLSPKEVVDAVERRWRADPDHASIAQVEGFIRQILGWREYMRGIYWAKMPAYASLNFFGHQRKLPSWFWTGQTKMRCVAHAVEQSLDYAYAHHIQRLMVTGNFALLAGIAPDEVDAWYLGIYIDAIEWVELPNTRGMSQFADGGIVGSKPYVSSAHYINKMSSYCKGCAYKASEKVGVDACPFNSLYWHFYDRHRELLESNPRIGMMYRTWDKMDPSAREALLAQAEDYLERLDSL